MFTQLLAYNDIGLFLLRLAVGIIFFYHALPKLKGAKAMAEAMGMGGMAMMVVVLGLTELVSSIGLVIGLYTQLAALLLGVIMVGAIGMKIMKWHVSFAAMDKTGWEFDLILLAANIIILLGGGGSIGITIK